MLDEEQKNEEALLELSDDAFDADDADDADVVDDADPLVDDETLPTEEEEEYEDDIDSLGGLNRDENY